MDSVVKTIFGTYLEIVKKRKSPFNAPLNTTLNQKFATHSAETVDVGDYPDTHYLCIGNGGRVTITNGNETSLKEVYHSPKHAALFNHLPLIVRPVGTDLSPTDMANYRMKVKQTIGGSEYYFYYMKKVSSPTGDPVMSKMFSYSGSSTVSRFSPAIEDLSPTPPDELLLDIYTHSDFLVVTDSFPFEFSYIDLVEILNAYQLLTGNTDKPIISEIAICSGKDKVLLDQGNNTYTESIETQVNYFINTYYDTQELLSIDKEINSFIELGGMSPLLNY